MQNFVRTIINQALQNTGSCLTTWASNIFVRNTGRHVDSVVHVDSVFPGVIVPLVETCLTTSSHQRVEVPCGIVRHGVTLLKNVIQLDSPWWTALIASSDLICSWVEATASKAGMSILAGWTSALRLTRAAVDVSTLHAHRVRRQSCHMTGCPLKPTALPEQCRSLHHNNSVKFFNFWRMASSGMLRRVTLVRADVSNELNASSIIRVTRIGELGTTLAVTSNRRTLRRNQK
jgi:hypothetical protein